MKDKMTYVIVSFFIKAVGSILDGGLLYENRAIKKINLDNDAKNIRKDWVTVGKGLNKVIDKYGIALKEKPSNVVDDGNTKVETERNEKDESLENKFINTGEIRNIANILNESNLPIDKKHQIMAVIQKKEIYSGPISHPEHLKQYEELVLGAANRLISMEKNKRLIGKKMKIKSLMPK